MFASKDVFLKSTGGYTIARSVRLRSSASAYLSKTPTVSGNTTTFTYSVWAKRGSLSSIQYLFWGGNNCTFGFGVVGTDELGGNLRGTGATNYFWNTSGVFRDPSAWYHIVWAVDTTQATDTNRLKVYVNGVQQTLSATYCPQNTAQLSTAQRNIGSESGRYYYDGYLAEINFIDGQALTPSSFGAISTNGVWQPARYTGTYGTNGFYLKFADNSTAAALGTDSSGNSNTWTVNNISVTAGVTYDSMTDVPTLTSATAANYATWNAVNNGTTNSYTFSNGNLSATVSAASGGRGITSTSGMTSTSGLKYYAELTVSAWGASNNADVGILNTNTSVMTTSSFALAGCIGSYLSNGYSISKLGSVYNNGTSLATGLTTFADGDVVQIAYDGTYIYFGKNGTWLNSAVPSSGTGGYTVAAGTYAFAFGVTSNTSQTGTVIGNFGQRPFTYTAPTGFVALNTYNLSTPTIANGAAYMAATLYTGNNSTLAVTNTVNGVSMQPDLLWLKTRSGGGTHVLYDSVRGNTKFINSNTTAADTTQGASTGLTSFNSNGFTLAADILVGAGTTNSNGITFVAWQWYTNGGSTASNTSGSITSTVSAGATQGFSVVTYTGTGANATVGHGLGVAPSMIIVKARSFSPSSWSVYTSTTGAGNELLLNSTAASAASANSWNSTAPTSSVFSVGTAASTNQSSATYVAYCFAAVAGYSAFGSYTGNGSTDGPFIYTGFRPRFVLFKNSSNATGYDWIIWDSSRQQYNVMGPALNPNLIAAESTPALNQVDILSNGFKFRNTGAATNGSGDTIIYAAFAENPFKYSLAR